MCLAVTSSNCKFSSILQLQRFNLALDEIVQAAEQAGKIKGSGFIENQNQRFTLQLTGQPVTPEQFAKLIVKREQGRNVLLGDVATLLMRRSRRSVQRKLWANPAS